ncbi:hypothetical protein D9M68_912540 [compost metagenome]
MQEIRCAIGDLRILLDDHLDVVLVAPRRRVFHHLAHEVHRSGWPDTTDDAELEGWSGSCGLAGSRVVGIDLIDVDAVNSAAVQVGYDQRQLRHPR